jgi:CPA2 family monovalent cation:H+ antiporter-2
VGYGRVGRRIGEALTKNGIPFVVAEENREIVEKLRESGVPAVSGDASEPTVLIQAHIQRARMLVIATPDTLDVHRMIEIARTVNPRIETVVARRGKVGFAGKENAGRYSGELARPRYDPPCVRRATESERHK